MHILTTNQIKNLSNFGYCFHFPNIASILYHTPGGGEFRRTIPTLRLNLYILVSTSPLGSVRSSTDMIIIIVGLGFLLLERLNKRRSWPSSLNIKMP